MQTTETTSGTAVTGKKGKKSQTDNSGYEAPKTKNSTADAVAHYMDWAASERSYQFLGYNEIAQSSMGLSRLPRNTSDEVKMVRRAMGRARKILSEKYNRGAVTKVGVGIRATVDDLDRAKHDLTDKAKRLAGAADRYTSTLGAIDAANIPSTGEAGMYKQWVEHGAKELAKRLTSPAFKQALLPPAAAEKDE